MKMWLLTPSIRRMRSVSIKTVSLYSSGTSSASSLISSTSTLEYGHEQFLTFEAKVQELICFVPFLPTPPTTTIKITRMPGGANYRIIGITLTNQGKGGGKAKTEVEDNPDPDPTPEGENENENAHKYILRIPRKEKNNGTRMDREVAVLYYLETCTSIPVPEVVAFDLEGINGCPIDLPYIIQTRIPGTPLDESFHDMTFSQKKRFVRKLVDLYVKMDRARFSRTGELGPPSRGNGAALEVQGFDLGPETDGNEKYRTYAQQTTRDMLLSQFESWKMVADNAPKSLGEAELVSAYMNRLTAVTLQMEKYLWLGDNTNVLFHADLAPRNIFVVRKGPEEKIHWEISGIIDWEAALSVPRVMANRAPSWLWRWGAEEGYDESDEKSDSNMPEDSERAELKRLFEMEILAALPLFTEHAYKPRYQMLRRLCRFAIWGLRWKEDVDKVVEFLRDWQEMVDLVEK